MTHTLRPVLLALALLAATRSYAGAQPEPCACEGDCNLDGQVTVSEVITLINVVLGTTTPDACECLPECAGDQVCIAIVMPIKSVLHLLNGCP